MDYRLLDLRDELAYRRLSGGTLDSLETEILSTLTELLAKALPENKPLPQEVLEAIEEMDMVLENNDVA